jgi:CspA family cold shock protein
MLLEDSFRNHELDPKYRKFKHHILPLLRLKVGGRDMPLFSSKEMDGYCKKLIDVLWDKTESLKVFREAIKDIEAALESVNFSYDITRLRKFTSQITQLPEVELMRGIVKYYSPFRMFGFIDAGLSDQVFVHINDVRTLRVRSLTEGQHVEFILKESSKGLKAEDVQLIES